MSLATRCTACGTVFRVLPDQLRVSEGWVRCGRCDAVFDAAETLFDIDHGEPVVLEGLARLPVARPQHDDAAASSGAAPGRYDQPAASHARPGLPPPAQPPAAATRRNLPPEDDPLRDVVPADWHEHQRQRQVEAARRAAATTAEADTGALLRARSPEPEPAEQGSPVEAAQGWLRKLRRNNGIDSRPIGTGTSVLPGDAGDRSGRESMLPEDAAVEAAAAALAAGAQPSFVREAERAQFWRRPSVRLAVLVGTVLSAVLLLVQGLLLWRDPLAAQVPALTPTLQALCRATGCTVRPVRRIEQLSVDSSSLNRVDGTAFYRLQVLLRNRADTAVMMPAMDLTLTDNQGKLVSRRVLQAAELGLTQTAVLRGQELPIKVVLSIGDRRVDGYTLELFYP